MKKYFRPLYRQFFRQIASFAAIPWPFFFLHIKKHEELILRAASVLHPLVSLDFAPLFYILYTVQSLPGRTYTDKIYIH